MEDEFLEYAFKKKDLIYFEASFFFFFFLKINVDWTGTTHL